MEETMKDYLFTHDYEDDLDHDHDWGDPFQNLDLVNLTDEHYLRKILGPQRMGFEVKITSRLKFLFIFLRLWSP